MEKENITLDPRSSFTPSSSADIPVPPDGLVQRSTRIKRIQTTAMLLLFFAAVINYLDRSSLSVANLTIREELGLSATEIGALLSVFSLAYGIAQLPCGPLLDRVLNLRFSVVKIKTSLKSVLSIVGGTQKALAMRHRALTCKERHAAETARHIFFHPDYTVGFGIAPNHEPMAPTP